MTPSGVQVRKPSTPTTANPRPTACANCGGLLSSSSVGGLFGMRFQIAAYGERPVAPSANTTACASSSQALPVTSTTASTAEVIHAANRGPRESIKAGSLMGNVLLTDGRD
ncbi:MAG: hypothetical protein QOI82_1153 [Actinomycetota bacterium]|nr:hypothetical protein [Actinomycetota bacterium]